MKKVIGLPHEPKYAPSLTEEEKRLSGEPRPSMKCLLNDSVKSIKQLATNFNWLLLAASGGLIVGVKNSLV